MTSFGPSSIALAWNAVADADVYGYELLRADASGGPYAALALVSDLARPGRRGEAIGVALGATSAGAIAGPALGGSPPTCSRSPPPF